MTDKTLGAYERTIPDPDDMDGGVTAAAIEKEAEEVLRSGVGLAKHFRDLLAAHRARTGTSTAPLEQRIRDLHTTDPDGNCTHCTRGRVYPVPAPCDTVRALEGGEHR